MYNDIPVLSFVSEKLAPVEVDKIHYVSHSIVQKDSFVLKMCFSRFYMHWEKSNRRFTKFLHACSFSISYEISGKYSQALYLENSPVFLDE